MSKSKRTVEKVGGGVLVIEKEYSGTAFGRSMREVATHYNKGVFSQIGEFARLAFSKNRLSPKEYYDFRLFDDSQFDWEQKRAFAGAQGATNISRYCNVFSYSGIFGDKLVLYGTLGGLGFPVPETLAYYHKTRKLPCVKDIETRKELKAFLEQCSEYPLFTKPNRSSLSLGVASIASCDGRAGKLTGTDGRVFSVEDYLDDVDTYLDNGYLIQKLLVPHGVTRTFSGKSIATLRMLTLRTANGPKIHRVAWKIPAAHNPADNFWRSGNVIAEVDLDKGKAKRIVRGLGIDQELIDASDITGSRKTDLTVPNWQQTLDLVLSATEAFRGLKIIGWDIGVCDAGPVIVEANDLPDLRLHQIAEGRGIYDREMEEYVAYCKAEKKRLEREVKRQRHKHVHKEVRLAVEQSSLSYRKRK